jgi:amino acid adenylation domain-containing protein
MDERLYESALLRISADRHIWYMCCHHIIADGWSMQLLVQRTQAAYQGRELKPTSFAQLAEAKRHGASRIRQRASAAYWRAKLDGQDRRGTTAARQKALSATRIEADLGVERTRALRRLAEELDQAIGGSQLAVLDIIAAAAVAWWGAHGNQRVVLGTPFHNRRRGAEREAVGLFMAIYPLCHEIRAGDTLADIMRRNRAEVVGAIRHRDHVVRDAAGERMFDVLVNYLSISEPTFCGMPMQVRWLHNGVADEALAMQLHDFGDGSNFRLQLDVRADVLPEVERSVLLSQLLRIIDTLLADADTQVTAIELAGPADYAAIAAFNATAADYGPFQAVHELIAGQAARAPDRIAVIYEGHHLSYAELERRADALAARLIAHGVAREVRVCVFLPRGIEVVVAVLAILKAGGSYVLVDAEQSAARLAHVIADAAPAALIAAPGDQRIAGCGLPVLPALGHDEVLYQRRPTSPRQAAYVTYTSGSTGAPKGCVIEHANLLNSYRCWAELFELGQPHLRHLQMASPSFDVFTAELVRALCSGGTMVVCPFAALVDPQALHRIICAEGVTHCEFVPVLLRSLVAYLARTGTGDLTGVRLLATGSDVWSISDHRQLAALCSPQARLWNGFGLTETSIDSALVRLSVGDQEGDGRLPVGRPMANQRLYMVDDRLRPAPVGIAGECYIGGAGVGRAYHAHPALTAERFVPDPFATDHPGARMYRTGDRLRLCADGSLEYLGRSDAQVKVNGARVQPGEIEACLRRHPSVSGAAVVLSEPPEGPAELIAYVVESGAVEASASALRGHLRDTLPAYQIPRRFFTVPAIPLTASGKVDRAALPAPRDCESLSESALIPPRNDFERLIAEVWCDVLGRANVSVLDNFFDVGGHSLALVIVHERISVHFDDRVTIPMLFEHPTVAALAAHLAASAVNEPREEPLARVAAGAVLSRQRSVRGNGSAR